MAVLLTLNTDNPLLEPANLDVSTVEATTALRAAVVAALPQLARVVMVMDVDEATLMCLAHSRAMQSTDPRLVLFPPGRYIAPEDR